MRVGIGYDSHRFADGRRLVLGGVAIPGERGLEGHSDADAIAHAVTDAVLGAAGMGDIGALFPPSDARWTDADSIQLLRHVIEQVRERGLTVGNVDVTVICESPRIGPHVPAMRARLAAALGVDPERVNVKGKTNEGMGWVGRNEGLGALAVASLLDV